MKYLTTPERASVYGNGCSCGVNSGDIKDRVVKRHNKYC